MRFTWDEEKRQLNVAKHGLDFLDAPGCFAGPTVTFEDDRKHYFEQRFVTFGFFSERIIAIVHTETSEEIRVISMRKASRHEREQFLRAITK